ncbi:MAG: hypothetical protein V7K48_19305 [Nostoc sp.]|uniref:hypothetical protein n=1 Tax=Nostoc sp. TaxID=1180 RepID=UPI002FFCCE16
MPKVLVYALYSSHRYSRSPAVGGYTITPEEKGRAIASHSITSSFVRKNSTRV